MSEFANLDGRAAGGCSGAWLFELLAFFMPLIIFLSSVVGLVPIDPAIEPGEEAMDDSLMRRPEEGMSMPIESDEVESLDCSDGRRSTGFKGCGVTFWFRLSHFVRSAHWRDSVHWRDSEGFMLALAWVVAWVEKRKALAVVAKS